MNTAIVWVLGPASRKEQELLRKLLRENGYSARSARVFKCNNSKLCLTFNKTLTSLDQEWIFNLFRKVVKDFSESN